MIFEAGASPPYIVVPLAGYSMLDTGYSMLDTGYSILDT